MPGRHHGALCAGIVLYVFCWACIALPPRRGRTTFPMKTPPPVTPIWSDKKSTFSARNTSPFNRSSSKNNGSDTSAKNIPSEGSSISRKSNSSDQSSSSSRKDSWSSSQNGSSSSRSSTGETTPPKQAGDATTGEIDDPDLAQFISKFKREIEANRNYRTPFMDEPVPLDEIEVISGVMNFELPDEGQAAAEGYAKFAVEIRRFYLNLLVRPSWQKKREDLRTAFAHGLIHYDVNRDQDPEFTLEFEIPGTHMSADEAKKQYQTMHFRVDDVAAILPISERRSAKDSPGSFHGQAWPNYGDFIPWFRIQEYDTGPYTPHYCGIHKHPDFAHFIDIVYSVLRREYIRCAVRFPAPDGRGVTAMAQLPDVCKLYDRYVYMPAWLFWHHDPHLTNPATAHEMLKRGYEKWFSGNYMSTTVEEFPWILNVHCKGCFLNYLFTERSLLDLFIVDRIMRGSTPKPTTPEPNPPPFQTMLSDIASILTDAHTQTPSRTGEAPYEELARKEFNQLIFPDLLENDFLFNALNVFNTSRGDPREGEKYKLSQLETLVNLADAGEGLHL